MMKIRHIVSLGAAVAAMAVLLWGQAMTRIEGVVKGEDGNPIQGAEIQIDRTDIKAKMPLIKSGKDGKFTFPTLQKGTYDVVITSNGKQIYQETGIQTNYEKPIVIEVDPIKKKQEADKKAGTAAKAAGGYAYVGLPGSKLPPLEAGAPVAPGPGGPAAGAAGAGGAIPAGLSDAEIAVAKEKYDKEMAEYEANQGKMKGLQDAFAAGRQAIDSGNMDVAIAAFQKAGTFDPKQDAVWANLGDAYRRRADAGKGSQRQEDYANAAEAFSKALALKPADASLYVDQSLVLARAGKAAEAQAALDKGVALDKTQASRGYRNLGAVNFEAGNSQAAEIAYRKAIEFDPTNADAHYQLGLSLIQRATDEKGKLKAPEGTAEAFQEYLALAPTGANAADAKSMLEALDAPLVNRINQRNQKAKAKGK